MTTDSAGYRRMWDEYARIKSGGYLDVKFRPDSAIGFRNALRERLIFSSLELRAEDHFLDVGCASGRQTLAAAGTCGTAVGVDIAFAFVAAASERAGRDVVRNARFVVGTADRLPFRDRRFDKVLCGEVLEHVPDPTGLLAELRRVIRPGGRLILTVPNLNGDGTWFGRLRRAITGRRFQPLPAFTVDAIREHGDAHVREFDVPRLRQALTNAGFVVDRIQGTAFLDLPPAERVLNRLLRLTIVRWLLGRVDAVFQRSPWTAAWSRQLIAVARASGTP